MAGGHRERKTERHRKRERECERGKTESDRGRWRRTEI